MSIFYLDPVNGNDATTNTPLGWWSVAFTSGSVAAPVADELVTGAVSLASASVTVVGSLTSGAWAAGTAAGTMYFYGKSGTFQAEQVNFAGGGNMQIASDFTYCAWQTITSGPTAARTAPGDTIRIAKSTDPVNTGVNSVWKSPIYPYPSAKNIVATTYAEPINVQVNSHGYSDGSIIYIQNHTTNLLANGTWKITYVDENNFTLNGSSGSVAGGATGNCTLIDNHAVQLDSALTKTIDRCEQAWTLANSSTVTLDTSQYKEGDASAKIVKASPSNSTLYAYKAVGGDSGLDLSSYQKVSFWIRNATAITANQWNICLCSGSAGDTPVDTIAIPAIPSTNYWVVLSIARDGGGNLGSAIKSVALYSGTSAGSTTGIYLDNIIACTTSGLNLQSLVSRNTCIQSSTSSVGFASEPWLGIQSISEDGRVIRLDTDVNDLASENLTSGGGSGYSGVAGSGSLYIREGIKTTLASSTSTAVNTINEAGTSGNDINYYGGYDPTTNACSRETFFDGQNGNGYGLACGSRGYLGIKHLSFVRYYQGINMSANYYTVDAISDLNNCSYAGMYAQNAGRFTIGTIINAYNNATAGLYFYGSSYLNNVSVLYNICGNTSGGLSCGGNLSVFDKIVNMVNNGTGLQINGSSNVFNEITNLKNNYGAGISFSSAANNKIYKIEDASNNTGYVFSYNNSTDNHAYNVNEHDNASYNTYSTFGRNYFHNCMCSGSLNAGTTNYVNASLFSQNHNNVPGECYIAYSEGYITTDQTNRHTESGYCWKMAITSTFRTSLYPLKLSIAKIACAASSQVTVKCWFKKSHATNVGAMLVCPGKQIAGVDADVTATKANDTDYEELTINFTPTVSGVVEIEAWAYSPGATSGDVYVDDLTITQA